MVTSLWSVAPVYPLVYGGGEAQCLKKMGGSEEPHHLYYHWKYLAAYLYKRKVAIIVIHTCTLYVCPTITTQYTWIINVNLTIVIHATEAAVGACEDGFHIRVHVITSLAKIAPDNPQVYGVRPHASKKWG